MSQGEECVICLERMNTTKSFTMLACGHTYHVKCISRWFQRKPSCPLCKRKYKVSRYDEPELHRSVVVLLYLLNLALHWHEDCIFLSAIDICAVVFYHKLEVQHYLVAIFVLYLNYVLLFEQEDAYLSCSTMLVHTCVVYYHSCLIWIMQIAMQFRSLCSSVLCFTDFHITLSWELFSVFTSSACADKQYGYSLPSYS